MRRIDAANATPEHLFRDANPGAGQQATSLNAQWCNDVQESLLKPIELSGRTPDGTPDQVFRALVDLMFRVGDYKYSEHEESPAVVFTWQTWVPVVGRVLVGLDDSQTEFNLVGKQGGAKEHTLTEAQMPSHSHQVNSLARIYFAEGDSAADVLDSTYTGTPVAPKITTNRGSSQAHPILNPYRVVRIWRRTA